ncbi:MAG: sodium:calcium antiporter [Jatrophihabitans sp.]|uniref:sodium:calcium antiporter n=1 Tax=Jatrophihabitans sp. TaxID=1932789 RepID=UPI003F7DD548
MSGLPSWLLLLIFLGSAAVIWVSGVQLSDTTDVLAERLHLGSALGGLIVLAVATNLPEIAITVSAAASHQIDVAVGNILGGIAIQTVVLVALDAFGVRVRKPLTYQAASLVLVLEGALVVLVLLIVVAGAQLPASLLHFRVTPDVLLITAAWVIGLLLINRASSSLPWSDSGDAPDTQPEERGVRRKKKESAATKRGVSTARAALVFGVAAVATLVCGVLMERSGDVFFGNIGLSGVLFGSTVLAAATSLPELSTGITSARMGDYQLSIGDIFGGNAFLPVLFLPATIISGAAVLPNAHRSDIYLTALGAVLTIVYIAGLIFRPRRQYGRMGPDSIAVLVLYALGVVGLVALQ